MGCRCERFLGDDCPDCAPAVPEGGERWTIRVCECGRVEMPDTQGHVHYPREGGVPKMSEPFVVVPEARAKQAEERAERLKADRQAAWDERAELARQLAELRGAVEEAHNCLRLVGYKGMRRWGEKGAMAGEILNAALARLSDTEGEG
jgi:hypothetical protein